MIRTFFLGSAWVLVTAYSFLTVSPEAEAGAALDRVQSAVAAVIDVVTRPDLKGETQQPARRAALRRIADELFDFQDMAQRALGRHWRTPSEAQRADFVALFTDLLERSYLKTIENYAGHRVIFLGETIEDGYATVRSKIVTTTGAEILVDYRLRNSATGWSVYDVALENVSLAANYRQQVNRVLGTTSFAGLLEQMRAGRLSPVVVPPGAGKPR
jgi:phospholipid transport system substrate-binding protein